MRTLMPTRLKPSRVKRMKESLRIKKEGEQLYAEFEKHIQDRNRLARKARKFSNSVRKRSPDMRLADYDDSTLHSSVEDLAAALYINPIDPDNFVNQTKTRFRNFFDFINRLTDVPWLKGYEE